MSFQRVSIDQIANFIKSSRVKTCSLDPLPASVITNCLSILLPVVTDIVSFSLEDASLPFSLESALITPLLKKPNLNPQDFKNFRAVSTEKVCTDRLHPNLSSTLRTTILESNFNLLTRNCIVQRPPY